jgi:L-lactate dehydrogenase (cytochrome)
VPRRRLPQPRELAPFLQFQTPSLDFTQNRLAKAQTVYDLRAMAQRRTPRAAFDYTEGAAEGEISLQRARQAFEDVEFTPSILRDVSTVSTGWDVLGEPVALPIGLAPTGFTRLMHTAGEHAGARAAGRAGIPFSLSTLGTTTIESVAEQNPNGRNWFQLYLWKDQDRSMELIERAARAGFDTLLVTVDVPVAGARLRDKRNGFSLPPALTLRTLGNVATRPRWWFDLLTTEPLQFASLSQWSGTVAELLDTMFDPSVDFNDLQWVRDQWPGKLVVKGIQSVDDAKRVAQFGVDGIVLSNHGGRQLDRAPVPFHLLPAVVGEVGSEYEIMLDTGIMSGADVVAAIALGARCTLLGRAYLYGLMAGGEAGVERMLAIIGEQVARTMRLLGINTLEALGPQHVTQLIRFARG